MALEVVVEAKVSFRGKEATLRALLSKKVWYNAMLETAFMELFGESWSRLRQPAVFHTRMGKISVDKYAVITVEVSGIRIEDEFYISDALVRTRSTEADLIVGSKTLERYRIRILA